MTARFLVGDVRERQSQLPTGSFDLILCSPPFFALRSYLPDGHPDKAREIGSEATPAEFLATLLELTAEWRRLLAPHGSIAIELGDTYAGSGGAGGDYNGDGLRDGQQRFNGAAAAARAHAQKDRTRSPGPDWPLDKSLCGIPAAYMLSLAYGRNVLSGEESPAGMWRVRNLKPWIRSNPPVGALGDKERPATSYVVVATRARDRYFDLDTVRSAGSTPTPRAITHSGAKGDPNGRRDSLGPYAGNEHPAGAPPRDWWHHVDAVIDAVIDEMAGKPSANPRTAKGVDRRENSGKSAAERRGGGWSTLGVQHNDAGHIGARGVHIRRRLEAAGILRTLDALDVSPSGYSGAHYAVWPKELVRLLVNEMCPGRVCTTCGQPSRRTQDLNPDYPGRAGGPTHANERQGASLQGFSHAAYPPTKWVPSGWSDCGHDTWRPGRILDPFVGSGTTLEVATGMGRDAIGIDLDARNADLALERVGMFLDVDQPTRETPA